MPDVPVGRAGLQELLKKSGFEALWEQPALKRALRATFPDPFPSVHSHISPVPQRAAFPALAAQTAKAAQEFSQEGEDGVTQEISVLGMKQRLP